jgi:hypothetical protein
VKPIYLMLLIAVGACTVIGSSGTSSTLWAQQAAGSITGTVVDPAGSAIPNAIVTVRDVDRGTTWTTRTSESGLYEFPQIPVGNIVVKVQATGFPTQERTPFSLLLNQVARLDFQLKLGQVNELVTVNSAPPLLQTASTDLGTLIDSNAAANLPLATRDINQLTLLAPGVLTSNIFAFESPQTTFGTGRPYVNGAREQDNNFSLDGMDINQPDNNDVSYTPSPDAVQEFNIITSNAAADYGNYAGGVIVESTKSGTNKFHGNLFEYLRNEDLNANTWQDKANGSLFLPDSTGALVQQSVLARPILRWNEFGGTIGGPIIRNKLFFFADEETSLFDQPATAQVQTVIPYTSWFSGDLSSLCTANGGSFTGPGGICTGGTGQQLYMPANGVAPGARMPIPNNKVPINSSVASKLVALPQFQSQLTTGSYLTSGYTHNFQGDAKIDWQPSISDHIMGRYSQMFTHVIQSNGADALSPNLERQYPLKNIVVDYVRTISPTLVNDFRLGTQIFPANDQVYTSALSGNVNSTIGLPGVPVNILPAMNFGYGAIGNADGVEVFHDTTNEVEDSLTWTHGRHSIHTGFEYYHYMMNDTYAGNNGEAGAFNFSGQYTGNSVANGNGFADFLLGLPQTVAVGQPIHFHLANSLFAGFAQDNYQVTPHLTMNVGLRYEVVTPRGDKTASNNINFDKITGAPELGTNYKTYYGIGDFEPRLGLAYQPAWAPNTVFRAAYTISSYMEGNGISNMAVINPPNSITINQSNTSGSNLAYPQYTLDNGYAPYQNSCTAAELVAAGTTGTPSPCLTGAVTHATDPNLRPAMNQQWNLTVQHQFRSNLTASLGYVGNKDDHMSDIYWYNQKVLTSATQQVKDASGNLVTVPAVAPGPFMKNLVAAGVGQARYNASDAISRYEALEATVSQKNYHGLDMQANFTWSKCLSNSLGYFGSYGDEEGLGEQQNEAGGNFFQNEYNPRGDYGKCTIDAAAAFNGYALYNLPFGRGKQFANNVPWGLNEVIGGWNLAFDTTFRSGFAVTPYAGEWMGSFNPAAASNLTAPSYVPRASCAAGASFSQAHQFAQIGSSIGLLSLNPSAVQDQADGQFGNCQVGSLRGPSLKTADLNINKQFPITEKVNMTFMAQFMNLTNTPIFSIANTWDDNYSSCESCTGVRTTGYNGGGNGTVGVYGLLDGSNPGREIEFALKLNF